MIIVSKEGVKTGNYQQHICVTLLKLFFCRFAVPTQFTKAMILELLQHKSECSSELQSILDLLTKTKGCILAPHVITFD